jgi:hypothetical protein
LARRGAPLVAWKGAAPRRGCKVQRVFAVMGSGFVASRQLAFMTRGGDFLGPVRSGLRYKRGAHMCLGLALSGLLVESADTGKWLVSGAVPPASTPSPVRQRGDAAPRTLGGGHLANRAMRLCGPSWAVPPRRRRFCRALGVRWALTAPARRL